jgi:DNA-binding protein HU-beta
MNIKGDCKVIRKDLVRTMSEQTHMTMKDCSLALEAFIETVKEALEKGDSVKIASFGVFSVKTLCSRTCHNLHTMQMQEVPERTLPKFKFSKVLKDQMKLIPVDDDEIEAIV